MSGGYYVRTYPHWRYTETRDPNTGAVIHEWAKIGDIAGRAYPGSTSDTIAAAQPIGIIVWTFACAAGEDLQAADQIRFDGRTLDVKAVPVTSRGDRIEARCEEVQ